MSAIVTRHKQIGILADRALCSGLHAFRMVRDWSRVTCSQCLALRPESPDLPTGEKP